MITILCLATRYADSRAVDADSRPTETDFGPRDRPGHKRAAKFTVEQLLGNKFPHAISDDLDLDICKAGGFLGDIALPNIKYETEWRQQKLNKSYLEELEKYRDEVLKEGLQVEEEGLTEILQFKNEHDANEAHRENDEIAASQEKSEPIMVDRNQYSMDGDLGGGFSFNARNDDAGPGVRDEGVEFRLESTTQSTKKRHSARKNHQSSHTISTVNATKSMHAFPKTSHELSSSTTTTENTNQMKDANVENIEEAFTVQPETSTQNVSKRRHRRHHRRRYE